MTKCNSRRNQWLIRSENLSHLKDGWFLLVGSNTGIMNSVLHGAKDAGGETVWILPTKDPSKTSEYVDIALYTNMWSWRNVINVLSSDIVIACGMGAWTASEISLALKKKKALFCIEQSQATEIFFQEIWKKMYISHKERMKS